MDIDLIEVETARLHKQFIGEEIINTQQCDSSRRTTN